MKGSAAGLAVGPFPMYEQKVTGLRSNGVCDKIRNEIAEKGLDYPDEEEA